MSAAGPTPARTDSSVIRPRPGLQTPVPSVSRLRRFTRSPLGLAGLVFLAGMLLACLGTLPYTLSAVPAIGAAAAGDADVAMSARYNLQTRTARHLPPWWAPAAKETGLDTADSRLQATARLIAADRIAGRQGGPGAAAIEPTREQIEVATPRYWLGTDILGRSLLVRCLAGGGISLTIGMAAAGLSVLLGTMYGALAGYLGGRVDAIMMRIVDVLYGLPYILLVVLLAVASESVIDEFVSREKARARWSHELALRLAEPTLGRRPSEEALAAFLAQPPEAAGSELTVATVKAYRRDVEQRRDRIVQGLPAPDALDVALPATIQAAIDSAARSLIPPRELSAGTRTFLDLSVLFIAIGGVSWLTMARVVRGQVLSLKAQPFMEAARAMGVPVTRQFTRHLLPNLVGPITVYATLTVPQAILQESFLSFLGIGVRPPLPSWGNLAAAGLDELNPYQSRWWLLLFPCLLLGLTLLALNFVGEGLRDALDPKGRRR